MLDAQAWAWRYPCHVDASGTIGVMAWNLPSTLAGVHSHASALSAGWAWACAISWAWRSTRWCVRAPDATPAWGSGPAFHAHQIILEILSETGVIGLLLWLAVTRRQCIQCEQTLEHDLGECTHLQLHVRGGAGSRLGGRGRGRAVDGADADACRRAHDPFLACGRRHRPVRRRESSKGSGSTGQSLSSRSNTSPRSSRITRMQGDQFRTAGQLAQAHQHADHRRRGEHGVEAARDRIGDVGRIAVDRQHRST